MFRKTALLSTLVLCACGPASSPAPNIVSIEPEEVVRGEAATVTLELDAPLPVKIDYGKRTATLLGTPSLRIGGQEVSILEMKPDGKLLATVPADLTEGLQEVRLALGDGNESVREHGLTVLPPPPALLFSGEQPPPPADTDSQGRLLNVTNIQIEPIEDQVSNVPFFITLRAEGPEAASFEGRVQISTNKGRIRPNVSEAFTQGMKREQVVIDKPGGNVVLTVRVGDALVARSNPFRVSPK